MFEQTFENHITYGYGPNYTLNRLSSDDNFNVHYGRCSYLPVSLQDETVRAAQLIRNSTDDKLHLWLSGGVDSHTALWAFISARIPVEVLIMRWANDLNIHDISHGIIMCEKFQIPYKFVNIDFNDFCLNHFREYGTKYECYTPTMAAIIYLLETKEKTGCHILNINEPVFERYSNTKSNKLSREFRNKWKLLEEEAFYCLHRYFRRSGREAVPGFMQYTPELMYAYYKHPIMQDMLNNKVSTLHNSREVKHQVYGSLTPHLYDRQKLNGFEKYINGAPMIFQDLKNSIRNDSIWIDLETLDEWISPHA